MANPERTDEYYDEEARVYSQKRYPSVAENYVQFLFTRRRSIVLELIGRVIAGTKTPRSLLEMGCADGVLLRSIAERYPGAFAAMIGSDISEPMIRQARALTQDPAITYVLRGSLPQDGSHACALEIGVAALVLDTKGESELLARQLRPGGYLICSLAGARSFAVRWGSTASDRSLLKSYTEYEADICRCFTVEAVYPCGVYVPFLWRMSALGRLLQRVFELVGYALPEAAHERVYLLKKKA